LESSGESLGESSGQWIRGRDKEKPGNYTALYDVFLFSENPLLFE